MRSVSRAFWLIRKDLTPCLLGSRLCFVIYRRVGRAEFLVADSQAFLTGLTPSLYCKRTTMGSIVRALEPETTLINRVLSGDRNAFYALIEPCESAIFMAAWAFLKDNEKAEEAAQLAVGKAFGNLPSFGGELPFRAWIVQLTIEQARARAAASSGSDPAEAVVDYRPNDTNTWREIPCEALRNSQCRATLTRTILSLDEPSRIVFVLRDMQRFSIGETAKILRTSEADVRTCLNRARLQIRDELAPGMRESWGVGGSAARKAASC